MTDMQRGLPPLGVTGLIGRSFRLLFAHFAFLFPLAFVPALVLAGLTLVFAPPIPSAGLDPASPIGPALGAGAAVALFLNVLLGFVITGVMCLAALDALLGKRHTVGEYLGQTLRHIAPIVALGALLSIATGLGMLLAVVPGLYILARFLPWAPAVVFENAGWSGLGRAQDLTAGYRWPLVGGALLLGIALIAVMAAFTPLFAAVAGSGVLGVVVEGAFAGLYFALIAIFTALVYLRLREIKEGVATEEIAASVG